MHRIALTESGPVRGLPASDPRITAFKGIPFAAPPVGENRWRAPQPCPPWQGELQAFDFGPIGVQDKGKPGRDNFWSREWAVDFDLPMSEDCLYLNIWTSADGYPVGIGDQYRETEDTPLPEPGNLPVSVWFLGGGFQVGNTADMEFDGERIARRGVVVVTVSYRLNAFGFLAHPDITAETPEAPTNFGFLDQQCALRWVRRNITAFGGDPDRITIGGQSAGGMSVCAQLANPANRGLVHGAIVQSGIFFPAFSGHAGFKIDLPQAEQRGREFFARLGVSTLLEARKKSAEDILRAQEGLPPMFFTAVVDRVFCRVPVNEWFLDPGRVECPLFFSYTDIEMNEAPRAESRQDLKTVAAGLGLPEDRFLAAFGSAASPEEIQAAGTVPATALAVRCIRGSLPPSVPVWLARFSADIPGWDHPGAFHSSDIWFYFETLAKCWRPFTGRHYDLARQMCDAWANFIRTGSPGGASLPDWPPFILESPARMEFADTARLTDASPSPIEALLAETWLDIHSR